MTQATNSKIFSSTTFSSEPLNFKESLQSAVGMFVGFSMSYYLNKSDCFEPTIRGLFQLTAIFACSIPAASGVGIIAGRITGDLYDTIVEIADRSHAAARDLLYRSATDLPPEGLELQNPASA